MHLAFVYHEFVETVRAALRPPPRTAAYTLASHINEGPDLFAEDYPLPPLRRRHRRHPRVGAYCQANWHPHCLPVPRRCSGSRAVGPADGRQLRRVFQLLRSHARGNQGDVGQQGRVRQQYGLAAPPLDLDAERAAPEVAALPSPGRTAPRRQARTSRRVRAESCLHRRTLSRIAGALQAVFDYSIGEVSENDGGTIVYPVYSGARTVSRLEEARVGTPPPPEERITPESRHAPARADAWITCTSRPSSWPTTRQPSWKLQGEETLRASPQLASPRPLICW